jgi:sugar phosphate isomerase/epimerase
MNRRHFHKIALLASAGTLAGIPAFASNSRLRIGVPLFEKYDNSEAWVQILQKLGCRAAYCPVGLDADLPTIKAYEKAAKQADIVIAEVGAWSNPISPETETAKAAFDKCVRSLQLAEDIGANCCVNIAGSKHRENWSGPHEENFSEETFDQIVEVTRKIIDEVKPKRTFFTLEAMPWIFPESADSYLSLLKAIDRKAFAVHLDPVNMVTSPAVFYKNGDLIKECFAKLGPHIKSCHAKDLVLKQKTFMPQFDEVRPGLGKMDYRVFMSELRKYPEVPVMLEHLQTAEEYQEGMAFIQQKIQNE